MPMWQQLVGLSEQRTMLPPGSAIKMRFSVELAMALTFMPRSQLSSESFCRTAEAMRATSDAEAIMSPRSARTRCIRPMPTKDRQMSMRQKQTSTAMAVKFRKYMLFTPRLPSASFLKVYYNPFCDFFNTLFVNK